MAKSPKLYFSDSGLAAFLMGFQSAEALWNSRFAGALWENFVVSQWQKWRDWGQPAASLWYWSDQAGNEVDLLIESDNTLTAIECKLAERPGSQDLRGINRLIAFYGPESIRHAYIAWHHMPALRCGSWRHGHQRLDGMVSGSGGPLSKQNQQVWQGGQEVGDLKGTAFATLTR